MKYFVKYWNDKVQAYYYCTMTLNKMYKVGDTFWINNVLHQIVEVCE